jgi:hypothetical protein
VGSPETQITRHHFPAICDGRAEVPGIPFSAGESHSVADLQRSTEAERVWHRFPVPHPCNAGSSVAVAGIEER